MKKYILLFIICLLLPCSSLFAQSGFSLRLAPVINSPVNAAQLNPGMGVNALLDCSLISFYKFNLGLSFGGGFASVPVQVGDPFTLLEGKGGLFLRWQPFDRWALQTGFNAGIYQHSRGEDTDTRGFYSWAVGAQFNLSPYFSLFSDLGYTQRVFSSKPISSFDASLGIRINLSEIMSGRARVNLEKTEQYRVFPVSYAWYEDNPVAMIRITNEEPNSITDLQMTFFMDSYMTQSWTFSVIPRLVSGESIDVPVTALFNQAMMNLTETVIANGSIQMQYRSLGARKDTVVPIQMPIFHRNTLSWDDDRRAAAFVSPRDSAARFFARYVAAGIEMSTGNQQLRNTPLNVVYAAALFEALRLYGITYVVVPSTSFARVSADESVLDNVSFPYQALYYKGGDCSYLSILFCSMLEALNVETAFITIPGHIYIAFDVGSNSWLANNPNIIEHNGKRWMPIELTVPNEGFNRAWRIGVQQWQRNGRDADLYPIREAWEIYPSVTVPRSGDNLPVMPQWDTVLRAMERELGLLR